MENLLTLDDKRLCIRYALGKLDIDDQLRIEHLAIKLWQWVIMNHPTVPWTIQYSLELLAAIGMKLKEEK